MESLKSGSRELCLINVASQLGAGRHISGSAWLHRADMLATLLEKSGARVNGIQHVMEPQNAVSALEDGVHYLDGVIQVCRQVRRHVQGALQSGLLPVTLGGDHSLAIGSAGAVAAFAARQHQNAGLFWADAHIDMNTPHTSPSGNIHGMALAVLCGLGLPALVELTERQPAFSPDHTAMLGLRFADATEMRNVMQSGIEWHTRIGLQSNGLAPPLAHCIARVASAPAGFHFTLDLDLLDPGEAAAINTPCPGGLSVSEALQVCTQVAATGKMLAMDLVEYNSDFDPGYKMLPLIARLIIAATGG